MSRMSRQSFGYNHQPHSLHDILENDETYEDIELQDPGEKLEALESQDQREKADVVVSEQPGDDDVLSLEKPEPPAEPRNGLRVWAIIVALSVTQFLTALESTVVATALPTIVAALDVGLGYVWVSAGYLLASVST